MRSRPGLPLPPLPDPEMPFADVHRLSVFSADAYVSLPFSRRGVLLRSVVVTLRVPDRETGQVIDVSSPLEVEDSLYDGLDASARAELTQNLVQRALAAALAHEVYEQARVDGARWVDPHDR